MPNPDTTQRGQLYCFQETNNARAMYTCVMDCIFPNTELIGRPALSPIFHALILLCVNRFLQQANISDKTFKNTEFTLLLCRAMVWQFLFSELRQYCGKLAL